MYPGYPAPLLAGNVDAILHLLSLQVHTIGVVAGKKLVRERILVKDKGFADGKLCTDHRRARASMLVDNRVRFMRPRPR